MKSKHMDKFNHDEDAPGYDEDVLDETNPIRTGYGRLLSWVAAKAAPTQQDVVVDLGCGTGNLTLKVDTWKNLTCVDVSEKMLEIAKRKLAAKKNVEFIRADLLEFFEGDIRFDVLASSYAVHHLTEDEKMELFSLIRKSITPEGRAVFGDLMFVNDEDRREYLQNCDPELAADIRDEFFWNLDDAKKSLESLGFRTQTERFSPLSHGIVATLPP